MDYTRDYIMDYTTDSTKVWYINLIYFLYRYTVLEAYEDFLSIFWGIYIHHRFWSSDH